ncbi:MAG: adenylyltransferase/cytidyltransferase family protein [Lachnospiraceae bacterium]|nr:adenylyltransferase/cytidyltransferase family protein [Lachnospiraceae bacterium]
MKLQYKQAINISFELQEIFRQVFAISTNTVQQTELNNLTGQLIDRVKKVIHIFCRDLEDDMSDLKMLFTQLKEIIGTKNVTNEIFEDLLHKINVMCISEILKEEENLSNYIDGLQMACQSGFSIFITICDTPCGSPDFTFEMGERLRQLGLNVNLSTKFRASYCAIIDEKKVLEEQFSEINPLTIKFIPPGKQHIIEIKSRGFDKTITKGTYAKPSGECSIRIDGKTVTVSRRQGPLRGISFVVYDIRTDSVLDSVNFDTCETILAYRDTDNLRIKEFIKKHPHVVFLKHKEPVFPTENLSDNEKYIYENNIDMDLLRQNPNIPCALSDYIKEPEGIIEVLHAPKAYIGTDGTRHLEDCQGTYLNIVNGHRLTVGQPSKFKRVIYLVGGCITLGIGNRDEGTIASQLQKLLNENAEGEEIIVENYGHALKRTDVDHEIISILSSLPLRSGDMVIDLGGPEVHNSELDIRPYKYGELFWDGGHLTETATMLVAKGIFDNLKENDFYREYLQAKQKNDRKINSDYGLNSEQLLKLEDYKKDLSEFRNHNLAQFHNIGSIVMNCNPFTKGHRYLIEESAKKCDCLIVFVVQEDKSHFPFSERFALVKKGCADLKNVYVIGSGKFIISSLTFESYFNKKSLQDRVIDCSDDVTLFVNEIVPALDIKVRFVGTEPIDTVTNQYNRTLERMLTLYGIDFIEIPRKEINETVISASKVRELLKEHDWEAISQLVPPVTLEYLKQGDIL